MLAGDSKINEEEFEKLAYIVGMPFQKLEDASHMSNPR